MDSERKEKFNPVKIAIGAFIVLVVVVAVVAVVSLVSGNGMVTESEQFAKGYEDGDNSEEKKQTLSVLNRMRELFKKNIRAQVTISPAINKTYPNYFVKDNYVTSTNRSYGFKIEGISKDLLSNFGKDIDKYINQIGLNGFHEYASVPNAQNVNFANGDESVVCAVPKMASSDFTVSCASVKWYDQEERSLTEAIISVLPKANQATFYRASKNDIIDSEISGYQRIEASAMDGVALFYRVSGGNWVYFKTIQGLPDCSEFNKDVLKKSFYGMECNVTGTGHTSKVGA